MFVRALLRPPPPNFAEGLKAPGESAADVELALEQHHAYCAALEQCGVSLSVLSADPRFPDSCFVEDTAILTPRGAIVTRPGAPTRRGEVDAVEAALRAWFPEPANIEEPGTVEGGDVCEAEGHYLIGISGRTNEEGARQLADWLARLGYPSSTIDIRGGSLLHLKSGLAYIGDGRMLVTSAVPRDEALAPYEQIEVADAERYAANCVNVNDRLLIAAGCPQLADRLARDGYELIPLEMSEYRKMNGGISCLSLRF